MKLCWLVLILWRLAVNFADNPVISVFGQSASGNRCSASETCISIYTCPSLLTLLQEQGRNAQVASSLRQKHCGFEAEKPKVCCPSSPPLDSSSSSSSSQKLDFSECGKTTAIRTMVFVKNSWLGDWPWMVALGYSSPKNPGPEFRCEATLISRRWVITAAKCVQGIGNYKLSIARIGDLDLDNRVEDGASPIDETIDQIIPHPQYSTNPVINDIALIRLKNPVQYTANIRPVCLLSGPEYKLNEYYKRKLPINVGWGSGGWDNLQSVTRLKHDYIKILNETQCAQIYLNQNTALINDRVLCAGEPGFFSCLGYFGGPLLFPNSTEARIYLGGIASYGIGCASEYPRVYTRVAQFIDWINQVTGEKF